MTLKLEWTFSNMPHLDIASVVSSEIGRLAREFLPDLSDMFPMGRSPEMKYLFEDDWMIFKIKERYINVTPCVGKFKDEELDGVRVKILPFNPKSHRELYSLLGTEWFSFDCFTYVGLYSTTAACWPDLHAHIIDWLNHMVIPEILKRNQTRISRAIPSPPNYQISSIIQSLWVLECEETSKQGTGFELSGLGIVTCNHVLGSATRAFRADNPSKKYEVIIIKKSDAIDLAIIHIDGLDVYGLEIGSLDNLKQMDHIAISGFPNYRLGDSGVIVPGLVIGFRMVSGVRRILTNAPIVAGNSGGPVFDEDNRVIGIAVTGADRMEDALETENHGIIPVDAIHLL